jgi:hypothetical protein
MRRHPTFPDDAPGLGPCYFRTDVGGDPFTPVFVTGYATGYGPGPNGTSVLLPGYVGTTPIVGPTTPGDLLQGGTAGALAAAQRSGQPGTGGWLAGLSHTTAGLNWTHLALWLAILAGAYIVLDHYARGGKRRRR